MADEQGALPFVLITAQAERAEDEDVALAVRGDAASFLQLYQRYVQAVHQYLYARSGNRHDAEDVTTVVFERAWTSLKHYRPSGSFRGWLFTIARRALADHYRHRQAAQVQLEPVAELLADPASGPEEQALLAEQRRQLFMIVRELTPEQQEVVLLRFYADLRYSEIAQVMGRREAAVKMIAHRALKTLQRRYHDVHRTE